MSKSWWKMTRSSPSAADGRVVIGRVGAPHGIRGELRVFPLTDFPDRFQGMERVYAGEELLDIAGVRYQNEKILLRFAGFENREKAAALTGRFLSVDRADAVPLEEGEYYTFDIIGLDVFEEDGQALGTVTEVLQTGSNDVYVVSKKGQAAQVLVPALKSVVREIDLKGGRMVVCLPEELEDHAD